MKTYKSRKEVPDKYKWDLTDLYKDDKAYEREFDELKSRLPELYKYKGHITDADKLYEFLELDTDLNLKNEHLYVYALLVNDQELGVTKSIERISKIEKLSSEYGKNINFFEPELLKLSTKEFKDLFIKNNKLEKYRKVLENTYRNKEHYLKEKEANIVTSLVSAMDSYENIYANLLNNEIDYHSITVDGEKIKLAPNNLHIIMRNKDEKIRRKAYHQFFKELEKHAATFASLFNSYVSMNVELAKIYNFKTTWDEKLFGTKLSNKVFNTLIKTTEGNLEPRHRFIKLLAKLNKHDKLKSYDLGITDVIINDSNYSIEDGIKMVKEAIKPLGSEYACKMNNIFDKHCIDFCQYKGKRQGAYSCSTPDTISKILMSYTDDLDSISTIAHEGGHNVNNQFMKENNPIHYRDNSTIVAEVTSLMNECLLSDYVEKNGKTKKERLAGIAQLIRVFNANFYGAVREGKLEQDMYKLVENGGTLTKDYLNSIVSESEKLYNGKYSEIDKYDKYSWVGRSHYYCKFYLFSYAISIAVATATASKILSGDKETLNKYIEFLKCGSDKDIAETFAVLGVNLEDKKVYEDAVHFYESLLDKFEEIYND